MPQPSVLRMAGSLLAIAVSGSLPSGLLRLSSPCRAVRRFVRQYRDQCNADRRQRWERWLAGHLREQLAEIPRATATRTRRRRGRNHRRHVAMRPR